MIRGDSKSPANCANLRVINAAAVQQRVGRADSNIRLIINNRIPDAVIHFGGDGNLAGRKPLFSTCNKRAVCLGV